MKFKCNNKINKKSINLNKNNNNWKLKTNKINKISVISSKNY